MIGSRTTGEQAEPSHPHFFSTSEGQYSRSSPKARLLLLQTRPLIHQFSTAPHGSERKKRRISPDPDAVIVRRGFFFTGVWACIIQGTTRRVNFISCAHCVHRVNKRTSFFDNYPSRNKPTLSRASVRGRCSRGWPGRPMGKNNKPNQQAAGHRSSKIECALCQRVRNPFPTSPCLLLLIQTRPIIHQVSGVLRFRKQKRVVVLRSSRSRPTP